MMCLELGWTTELGEAFVADQAGVLASVQRLRKQAVDVGSLQSSAQMKVETQTQEGQEVVVVKPAQPEVVYVPQYDPVAAYAPPAAPAAAPPATTTTTTTTTEDKGHSTGSLIATGVLAFGAGILVNELFDDDDDYDYYYPNYGYGGMPYYPPYPYRPAYGGGYYPSNGYNRPPGYNSGFVNTGNIVINTGGGQGGGYWDRYDDKPGRGGSYKRANAVSSPITAARPNRPELNELNKRQPRPMPADVRPPGADRTASNWKGQGSYAGAKPSAGSRDPQERIANAKPAYSKPSTREASSKTPPKVQGSYAGARPDRAKPAGSAKPAVAKPQTRDVQRPQQPSTRDVKRPPTGGGDRGYGKPAAGAKPAARPQPTSRPAQSSRQAPSRGGAVSPSRGGQAERAASQRGKQSMPQGARSKGGGGGGKQRR
jgi:hypothetical protein